MLISLSVLFAALLPYANVEQMPPDEAFGPSITCREANDRLSKHPNERLFFRIHGRVVATVGKALFFMLEDGTLHAKVMISCDDPFHRGDLVTVSCTALQDTSQPILFAKALAIKVEGHEDLPPPRRISPRELSDPQNAFSEVELVGIVTESFRDEVDPSWLVIAVEDAGARALVWCTCGLEKDASSARLVDARVGIPGVCLPYMMFGMRTNLGSHLQAADPEGFRILEPIPEDPFRASGTPGHRQLRTGIVTTVWNERSLFLREPSGESVEVRLAPDQTAPAPGTEAVVAAFIQSNAFYNRLANALIRPAPQAKHGRLDPPHDISASDILREPSGRPRIDARRHGDIVRIKGRVRDGHLIGTHQAQLLLDCDGNPVSVWIGRDTKTPEPGSLVEVTGACIINVEAGIGGRNDVRLNGFSVALRRPEELVVLVPPPWWTPAKLVIVIISMLALLTAILIWNRALRILAERRGRELLKTAIGKAEADLRTEERTRLAVELHDTIAQNLTGVTFGINTADRLVDNDPAHAHQLLELADRTLKSCRDELRNCIWDLRGHALEERDMNEAIRQAVRPHIGETNLVVRFNVPRTRISDNTVHALLRIIRELAINAVRHGQATSIKVAGGMDGETLLFSVRDDGCGFDPAAVPGVAQGHFGLQGIRERINRFNGGMTVESAPGKGSKITISIPAPSGHERKAGSNG